MKTLIELYDERPVENVLAPEVFRPERTVFLCPAEVAQNKKIHRIIRDFFKHRGIESEAIFVESSPYNAAKIKKQLMRAAAEYPDCVLDITGGTDAALFAGGLFCAETNTPVFTYSRKRNRFYNIHNAPFAEERECRVKYSVEDCFRMAGGALRMGRADNAVIEKYMDRIDAFFALYLRHRGEWSRIVTFIQRVSRTEEDAPVQLRVDAPYIAKGDFGSRISAPEQALREMEELGFIEELETEIGRRVSFRFRDAQTRAWLRDQGSVLELYIYKACLDTGLFQDVRTSAVVDWESGVVRDSVTNEIDVMAMRGIVPAFISCKTCHISTEALNELAILRDRFGGKLARAAIVTTQRCRNVTRHRAAELGIDVIDLDDLLEGRAGLLLRTMMRAE